MLARENRMTPMLRNRSMCRAAPGTTAPSIVKPDFQKVAKTEAIDVDLRHEIIDPVSGMSEAMLSRKVFIFSPSESHHFKTRVAFRSPLSLAVQLRALCRAAQRRSGCGSWNSR